MINEEIIGGLKSALARGESLEKAMMTFYNAGYDKTQIEEAARSLQMYERQPMTLQKQKPSVPIIAQKPRKLTRKEIRERKRQEKLKQRPVIQKVRTQPIKIQSPQPMQSISKYGNQNPRDKLLVIILVFMLLFLLSILATIFFFKDELISLFNNLFQNGLSLFSG